MRYSLFPFLLLLVTSPALAEKKEEGYSYDFGVEFVDGAMLDGDAARIQVRVKAGRVYLIRPRATFVPELLKSIEDF